MNHPGKIRNGYKPIVHCHTCNFGCQFAEILKRVDKETGKVIIDHPRYIQSGDAAIVRMIPCSRLPVIVEAFKEFPKLGRFVVRD